MLIIKEKGEKKMRRKLIAGSLAAMTLLSVPYTFTPFNPSSNQGLQKYIFHR